MEPPEKLPKPDNKTGGRGYQASRASIDLTVTSFGALRKLPQFIDQTEIIKVIMEIGKCSHCYEAPQGFGKSVKADMLKLFFDFPRDANGIPFKCTNPCESPNFQYFQGLKITEDEIFFNEHFGQYPVISIDFSKAGDFSRLSCKADLLDMFRKIISTVYKEHAYIQGSSQLASNRMSHFMKWFEEDLNDISVDEVENSLCFLIKCLGDHFKQPVFVIIDNLDAPYVQLLFSKNTKTRALFGIAHSILQSMIDSVTTMPTGYYSHEPYIKFLVTGVSFALASLTVSKTQPNLFLKSGQFVPYYGFTSTDVDQLCEIFHVNEDTRKKITHHCNGYRYRKNNSDDICIYDPRSTLAFLATGNPEPFITPDFLHQMSDIILSDLEMLWVFEHLLAGHKVEYYRQRMHSLMLRQVKMMMDEFGYVPENMPNVGSAQFDVNTKYRVKGSSAAALMFFLAANGCFNFVDRGDWWYDTVVLPNHSVAEYFRDLLVKKYAGNVNYRNRIHAAMDLEALLVLAKSEPNNSENPKILSEHLQNFATLFNEIVHHEFRLPGKRFSVSNIAHEFIRLLHLIPPGPMFNIECDSEIDGNAFFQLDIATPGSRLEFVIGIQISKGETRKISADAAIAQVFTLQNAKTIKAPHILALGCCVTLCHEKDNEKNFVCEFAGVAGERDSVKRNWKNDVVYTKPS